MKCRITQNQRKGIKCFPVPIHRWRYKRESKIVFKDDLSDKDEDKSVVHFLGNRVCHNNLFSKKSLLIFRSELDRLCYICQSFKEKKTNQEIVR